MTGTRLKRIEKYIEGDTFLATYGDGVSTVDLDQLIAFHRNHGKIATVTAVHPPARFGEMIFQDGRVTQFSEKPQTRTGLINGGFFVFTRQLFAYLPEKENITFEHVPMVRLTNDGQFMAYEHDGFWQCMDTVREVNILRELWDSGQAPWKVW